MAAIECGEYEAVIPYLENKFDIEFNPIKKAREIIKNRCLRLGMNGKTNPTMTIFNLVNNFDMLNTNAKQQVTAKIDGNITDIDYSKLSESALKEISALKSSEGPSGAV
jgi:phenylalanyl-tRNA synthetase alpha subunit